MERIEQNRCAICSTLGTLPYVTFSQHAKRPIEMDLCGEHLRNLVARHLGPHAFSELRKQLSVLGLDVVDIFLLHDAFYDANGRALQPVREKVL